jgi:hypothetical protein
MSSTNPPPHDHTARLEDFGARAPASPQERLVEYKEQARGLPKTKAARFWLGVLEHDAEVRRLVKVDFKEEHTTWKRWRRR